MFALSLFFFCFALSLKPQRKAANQLKAAVWVYRPFTYANEMIIVIEMTVEMTV